MKQKGMYLNYFLFCEEKDIRIKIYIIMVGCWNSYGNISFVSPHSNLLRKNSRNTNTHEWIIYIYSVFCDYYFNVVDINCIKTDRENKEINTANSNV